MALRVRYVLPARRFVLSEQAYLAEHSEMAAQRFRQRLSEAERQLSEYPEIGSIARLPGTRRFVVAPYVVTYHIRNGQIEILNIRHGRQHDPADPLSDAPGEEDN